MRRIRQQLREAAARLPLHHPFQRDAEFPARPHQRRFALGGDRFITRSGHSIKDAAILANCDQRARAPQVVQRILDHDGHARIPAA